MTTPTDALATAIRDMRSNGSPPSSLSFGWPDAGTSVLLGWTKEIERDFALADAALRAAKAAGPTEAGRTEVEHAYWRLASGRDRMRALTTLVLGVPAIEVRKRKQVFFRPNERTNKKHLNQLAAQGHTAATQLVDLNGRLSRKLLIRHQQSHGLPPILQSSSLVWIECGYISSPGGVYGYQASHIVSEGSLDEDNITTPVLFERALRLCNEARELLKQMIEKLAALIDDAQLPLPLPEIVWRVDETGEVFIDRQEAHAASRAAAGVTPVLAPIAP